MNDARRDCCKDPDNLEEATAQGDGSPDTVLRTFICTECGRRHYRAGAKPKRFGVRGREA